MQQWYSLFKRSFQGRPEGSYTHRFLNTPLAVEGISYEPSPPYSQDSNGTSDRWFGVLVLVATALLHRSKLPVSFWGEAVAIAAYIKNKLPSTGAPWGKPPWEVFNGSPPQFKRTKPFGCLCWYRIPKEFRHGNLWSRHLDIDNWTKQYMILPVWPSILYGIHAVIG